MSQLDVEIWDRLKGTRIKEETLTARTAFPEIYSGLLAGIDTDGNRHFLIPLSSSEDGLNDCQSRGINVTCEDLKIRGQEQTSKYIDIVCQDLAGQEAFDIIGHEIAVSLSSASIPKAESVSNVLARWRYFWGKPPSELLSREEVIGLFSELWYFNYWLLPYMKPVTAVAGWRGPHGSRHDFEWPTKSVEVKGSTSTKGRIHWIHGVDQLLPPEKGKLYLFSLRVREEGGATNTLPNLIMTCHKSLAGDAEALANFETALALTGYSPMYDDEYDKISLRVVDEALYVVKDSFPRITADKFQGGIPSGVEAVQYEINLDGHDDLILSRKPDEKIFKE
jgi:hypothetical protein